MEERLEICVFVERILDFGYFIGATRMSRLVFGACSAFASTYTMQHYADLYQDLDEVYKCKSLTDITLKTSDIFGRNYQKNNFFFGKNCMTRTNFIGAIAPLHLPLIVITGSYSSAAASVAVFAVCEIFIKILFKIQHSGAWCILTPVFLLQKISLHLVTEHILE